MMDLTKGPTFRNMLLYSLPIMLQGSFQIAYNLVDRYWVGNLGASSLGAVTVGFPVFFFMLSLVMGISIGGGIMIAQYRGADDKEKVNLTARNFFAVGGIAVIFISGFMLFYAEQILRLLDTPDDVLPAATVYMRWIFAGLPAFFIYNAATGILRGLGDSKTPTQIAAVTTVLNIIFDPLLIYGYFGIFPRMEVAGAAIATVGVNVLGAIAILVMLGRYREYVDLTPFGFRFDMKIIRDILRLGLPSAGTMMMVSFSMMIFMGLVNKYGTYALAGYGIGITLDSLLMMPAQSFAMAMTNIAGQNIGAGKIERVHQYLRDVIRASVAISLVGSLTVILLAKPITGLFQPDPIEYEAVLPFVMTYVNIMVVRYFFMSIFFPINGTIRGAGDALTSMILIALTQLVIRIPAAFILMNYWGFAGIAAAISISAVFGAIIQSLYYRTGRWIYKGGLVSLAAIPEDSGVPG
ncbi:MAG: MATE family efflux transporter [bacterium]